MRLVTWNCAGHFKSKWPAFAELGADLAVIQECETEILATASERGWTAIRRGAGLKGLALLAAPEWSLKEIPAESDWSIAAKVSGASSFTLVGFWALPPSQAGCSYTAQAEATAQYVGTLTGPVVLAGDFNATTKPKHLATMQQLHHLGLVSSYHQVHSVDRGQEADSTYFHQWKLDRGFHIDLMLIPEGWSLTRLELGSFETYVAGRISDHVPVTATVTAPAPTPSATTTTALFAKGFPKIVAAS